MKEVLDIVESWRSGFENSDPEALKAIWAEGRSGLTYVASEEKDVISGLPNIATYLDNVFRQISLKSCETWDVAVDELTPDVAYAVARSSMTYVRRDIPDSPLYGWNGKVSFTLVRERGGDWKVAHYEDSTVLQRSFFLALKGVKPHLATLADCLDAGDVDGARASLLASEAALDVYRIMEV